MPNFDFSLSIDGSSSTLHPFPRLVRSFDDFSPSTISLTHEQMVEQVFVQEGEMEELIAFDQQEPPHSTSVLSRSFFLNIFIAAVTKMFKAKLRNCLKHNYPKFTHLGFSQRRGIFNKFCRRFL